MQAKDMRLVAAMVLGLAVPSLGEVTEVQPFAGGLFDAQPMIVVGSATGTPPITPSDRIDPNSALSPFAGVVSIFGSNNGSNGTLGSGVAISPRHILTAAHVVDWTGGDRSSDASGVETGDGLLDAIPSLSAVFLNAGSPQELEVERFDIHPQWNGFLNFNAPAPEVAPSINDDLAIVTLSADLPASVPIYPLSATPFELATTIAIVGYGQNGHGDVGVTGAASFTVKRFGFNTASQFSLDDEPAHEVRELFLFDFDGPEASSNLDARPGLGNDLEVTIAPGDSGGPSFSFVDLNTDGLITADELTVFGINTFGSSGAAEAPLFGSWGGGMIVSSYLDFVTGVIPEPATAGIILPLMLLMRRRRVNPA